MVRHPLPKWLCAKEVFENMLLHTFTVYSTKLSYAIRWLDEQNKRLRACSVTILK